MFQDGILSNEAIGYPAMRKAWVQKVLSAVYNHRIDEEKEVDNPKTDEKDSDGENGRNPSNHKATFLAQMFHTYHGDQNQKEHWSFRQFHILINRYLPFVEFDTFFYELLVMLRLYFYR